MFAAVAKTDTAIEALIQRSLTAVGRPDCGSRDHGVLRRLSETARHLLLAVPRLPSVPRFLMFASDAAGLSSFRPGSGTQDRRNIRFGLLD
jgi:hypothetical protein